MLALFARQSDQQFADAGFVALAAMLSVYIGARLVTGDLWAIVVEATIASIVTVAARLAMARWLPAIGLFIFAHGVYDALAGPHTGVAGWYPPLCAGFDMIAGIGLLIILERRRRLGKTQS